MARSNHSLSRDFCDRPESGCNSEKAVDSDRVYRKTENRLSDVERLLPPLPPPFEKAVLFSWGYIWSVRCTGAMDRAFRKKLGKCALLFAGYFPLAPGSFASLIGVALWILISSKIFYYVLVLFVVILGFFLSHYAEKRVFMRKDAQRIVIDEVAGMLAVYLTFSFTADVRGVLLLLSGFLFFRFFDIVKPPPIRNVQNIGGGLGIMLDDLLSAFGAHLLLRLLRALL